MTWSNLIYIMLLSFIVVRKKFDLIQIKKINLEHIRQKFDCNQNNAGPHFLKFWFDSNQKNKFGRHQNECKHSTFYRHLWTTRRSNRTIGLLGRKHADDYRRRFAALYACILCVEYVLRPKNRGLAVLCPKSCFQVTQRHVVSHRAKQKKVASVYPEYARIAPDTARSAHSDIR